MDGNRVVDFVITGVAGGVAAFVATVDPIAGTGWPILASPLAALAVFVLLHLIHRKLHGMSFYRGLMDPIAQYEGSWLEYKEQSTTHRFSTFELRYDRRSDCYIIRGDAYDSEVRFKSHWSSRPVQFDPDKGELLYFFEGTHLDNGADDPLIEGCCRMVFDGPRSGRGYYWDLEKSPQRHTFTLTCLPSPLPEEQLRSWLMQNNYRVGERTAQT